MASSSSPPPSQAELRLITHNVPRPAPNDALSIIMSKNPQQKAIARAKDQQLTLLRQTGNNFINSLLFLPDYPFLKLYSLPQHFECPVQFIHMIWYLASAFTIAPEIVTIPLLLTIKHFRDQPCHRPVYQTIINLLSWFQPLQMWEHILINLRKNIHNHRNPNSQHPDNLILPSECFLVFFLSLNPHYNKTLRAISLRPSVELYDSSTLSANNLDCSRPI